MGISKCLALVVIAWMHIDVNAVGEAVPLPGESAEVASGQQGAAGMGSLRTTRLLEFEKTSDDDPRLSLAYYGADSAFKRQATASNYDGNNLIPADDAKRDDEPATISKKDELLLGPALGGSTAGLPSSDASVTAVAEESTSISPGLVAKNDEIDEALARNDIPVRNEGKSHPEATGETSDAIQNSNRNDGLHGPIGRDDGTENFFVQLRRIEEERNGERRILNTMQEKLRAVETTSKTLQVHLRTLENEVKNLRRNLLEILGPLINIRMEIQRKNDLQSGGLTTEDAALAELMVVPNRA